MSDGMSDCAREFERLHSVKMDSDIPSARRGSVLLTAHGIINGERQNVYGSPEDSFALIAEYWSIYITSRSEQEELVVLKSSDVAMMMTLFKIAREANQHKRDNIVDAAGYLGIYGDMHDECKHDE